VSHRENVSATNGSYPMRRSTPQSAGQDFEGISAHIETGLIAARAPRTSATATSSAFLSREGWTVIARPRCLPLKSSVAFSAFSAHASHRGESQNVPFGVLEPRCLLPIGSLQDPVDGPKIVTEVVVLEDDAT
jgi:hypothetical protein